MLTDRKTDRICYLIYMGKYKRAVYSRCSGHTYEKHFVLLGIERLRGGLAHLEYILKVDKS